MVLSLLLVVTGAQLVYWWYYYFYSFKKYNASEEPITNPPPVSIVICFKGLVENFDQNLIKIITQDYPTFELLLVNDFSPESDVVQIQQWIKNQSRTNIRMVNATLDKPGKKHALQEGISHGCHDLLLFTDMDCYPASSQWIQKMVESLASRKADVVLGYGPMEKSKGPIAWFSGFETVLTAMQYFSFLMSGAPYMSVGRNWLVKKELYLKLAKNARGQHLASGDDDLVFQALLPNANISACLDQLSFVFSAPKTRFFPFLYQKTRHISTSIQYPLKTKGILFFFALSFPLFYGLISWAYSGHILTMLGVFALCMSKWLLQSIFHYCMMKTLHETRFLLTFPLGEMALSIYYLLLSIWSFFGGKKW